MAIRKIVGRPTHRVEGTEKVTGQAIYTVDVTLPGMLWGKALRSPVPNGRIRRMDTTVGITTPRSAVCVVLYVDRTLRHDPRGG